MIGRFRTLPDSLTKKSQHVFQATSTTFQLGSLSLGGNAPLWAPLRLSFFSDAVLPGWSSC